MFNAHDDHADSTPETLTHTEVICSKCQNQATNSGSHDEHNRNFKEKFLRTIADFENFKSRITKERAQWSLDAKIEVLRAILPVFDDLERAAANLPTEAVSPAQEAWQNGIIGITKNIKPVWSSLGLEEIDCAGAFNPELHEALVQVHAENVPSGNIVTVLRKGYMLGSIVVRYAQVTVAQ